tara:strand:+ start:332 stop:571 length:240 start_codon:yes stop_codon:yes gene_type:complete
MRNYLITLRGLAQGFIEPVALGKATMRKSELPEKICVVCDRPFSWRKKWKTVWDEVRYCSDACRRNRNQNNIKKGRDAV